MLLIAGIPPGDVYSMPAGAHINCWQALHLPLLADVDAIACITHLIYIVTGVLLNIAHPVAYVVERSLIRHIVH